MDADDLVRAAERVAEHARLQLALSVLHGLPSVAPRVLATWLGCVATSEEDLVPLEGVRHATRVAGSLREVAWFADAEVAAVRDGIAGFFAGDDDDDDDDDDGERELRLLSVALANFAPARLGGSLHLAHGVENGWFVPETKSIFKAFAFFAVSDAVAALQDWADDHGIEHCARTARVVGQEGAHSVVRVPVPGAGAAALDVACAAVNAAGLPEVPREAREALAPIAAAGVALDIRVTLEGDVLGVGILTARPSTEDMLAVLRMSEGADARGLAAFEGALGVRGADWLECAVSREGGTVFLHYSLPGPA